MWISQLSELTGLPVDTIKYYLRVGVLPRGVPVGPLRAEYDESHVSRLTLIRALHDVGRLSLDQIRRIFDSVDETQGSLRDALQESHQVMSADLSRHHCPSSASLAVVDAMVQRQGWDIGEESAQRVALAIAVDTLHGVEGDPGAELLSSLLDLYAEHAIEVAEVELGAVDTSSREATVNSVVGTVLYEPLILLTRRLAQEHASRHWGADGTRAALQDGAAGPGERPASTPGG